MTRREKTVEQAAVQSSLDAARELLTQLTFDLHVAREAGEAIRRDALVDDIVRLSAIIIDLARLTPVAWVDAHRAIYTARQTDLMTLWARHKGGERK